MDPSELHIERNYNNSSEGPYRRDDPRISRYGEIAEHIASTLAPKTVLDAGCAMGFLVEKLRDLGIEAWGIELSDQAIRNPRPSVRHYCRTDSILDPLPQKYDLIVCINILERLPRESAANAVANLCHHTDDILFSSKPARGNEAAHINFQPVDYWVELFAQQGFFRDVDFEASFISPWALRLRRLQDPFPKIARNYDRKYGQFSTENANLQRQVSELQRQLSEEERKRVSLQEVLAMQNKSFENLDHLYRHLEKVWSDTQRSLGWRLLSLMWGWRARLAPPGSKREEMIGVLVRRLKTLVPNRGFDGALEEGRADLAGQVSSETAYDEWLKDHTPRAEDLEKQRQTASVFNYTPLISVVTPVFDPPPDVLRQAIESVVAQTYSNWELCLVDGGSTNPHIRSILSGYDLGDKRIRVTVLKQNLGISDNTNAALKSAEGEFVQFLDHDDVLAPDALFEAVKLLNEKPETDLIYFDIDKLSEDGRQRRDPFFKPDWSPELLLSANYLTHCFIRRSLVFETGLLDPDKDGAQDWDLAIKCSERSDRIVHIPKVLYHWRQLAGSTALSRAAKPQIFEAQRRCLEDHLRRRGLAGAQAVLAPNGQWRLLWPASNAKVSIIIPTRDKVEYLERCVQSISAKTGYAKYEIILVDNLSVEAATLTYYEKLRADKRITIVAYSEAFNYSAANNLGARHASGDILLFLNNDVEILEPDWLDELVRWAEQPGVGLVGAKLIYPDFTIQHAGVIMGMSGHASHVFMGASEGHYGLSGSANWYRNYMAVTGACMMVRREVFDEIGGFDEGYILAFGDVELCIRAFEKGYRNVFTPYARLIHHEGKSRGKYNPISDLWRGVSRFAEIVERGDPYYNPNLSYEQTIPALIRRDEPERLTRLHQLMASLEAAEIARKPPPELAVKPIRSAVAPEVILFGVVDAPTNQQQLSQIAELRGWFLTNRPDDARLEIYLGGKLLEAQVYRAPRVDVVMSQPEYASINPTAGFVARFDTRAVANGDYLLSCIAISGGASFHLADIEVNIQNELRNAPNPIPYIYVAGMSHSGSTLLGFLLNAHPEIASVGEVALVGEYFPASWQKKTKLCSCGKSFAACDFWRQVLAGMAVSGYGLDPVGLFHFGPPAKEVAHERLHSFVESVLAVSEKKILVDTSKRPSPGFMAALNPYLDVKFLDLTRNGRGVVTSWFKRASGGGFEETVNAWMVNETTRRQAMDLMDSERVLRVRYEALCASPVETLHGIFSFIGVEPDFNVLTGFKTRSPHHILGNEMRLDLNEEIKLDEEWRARWTPEQEEIFQRLGGAEANRRNGYDG